MKRKPLIILVCFVAIIGTSALVGWDRLGIPGGERVLQEETEAYAKEGIPMTWIAYQASLSQAGDVDARPALQGILVVSRKLRESFPSRPVDEASHRRYQHHLALRRRNLEQLEQAIVGATYCSVPPNEFVTTGRRGDTFLGLQDAIYTALRLASDVALLGYRAETRRYLGLARRITLLYRASTHWFAQIELLGRVIDIRTGALGILERRPEWATDFEWLETFRAQPVLSEILHRVSADQWDAQRNIRTDWRFKFGIGLHKIYTRVDPKLSDGPPQTPWQRADLGYRLRFSRRSATALAGASTVASLEEARNLILSEKSALSSGNWIQREASEALHEFDVLADFQIQDLAHRDLAVLYRDILVDFHRSGKLPSTPPQPKEDVFRPGKAYGYRLTPEGFDLWSVGPDRIDDQGTSPYENRNPVDRPPQGDITLRHKRRAGPPRT